MPVVIHFWIRRLKRTACGAEGEYSQLSDGMTCVECRRVLDNDLGAATPVIPRAPQPKELSCRVCSHAKRLHSKFGCVTGEYRGNEYVKCDCRIRAMEIV